MRTERGRRVAFGVWAILSIVFGIAASVKLSHALDTAHAADHRVAVLEYKSCMRAKMNRDALMLYMENHGITPEDEEDFARLGLTPITCPPNPEGD